MLYLLCGKRNIDCHLLRLKIPPFINRRDPDYSDTKYENIDKVTLKVSPLDVIAYINSKTTVHNLTVEYPLEDMLISNLH